jgi:hypothetical protein
MIDEEVLASQAQLSVVVVAQDVQKTPQRIACVGEATRFMLANCPPSRSEDPDWQIAAKQLTLAALTHDPGDCILATSEFIALLKSEGLFVAAE